MALLRCVDGKAQSGGSYLGCTAPSVVFSAPTAPLELDGVFTELSSASRAHLAFHTRPLLSTPSLPQFPFVPLSRPPGPFLLRFGSHLSIPGYF